MTGRLENKSVPWRRLQSRTADAAKLMIVGAVALAVGTAIFHEPQTALQVIAGLREFMQRRGLQDVREIGGGVQVRE